MAAAFCRSHYLTLLFTALVLGGTTLGYPTLGTDAGVFTYIGNTILEGGLPYRDAWDPTGPGVFFVYAAKNALLGHSDLSVRLFDLIWQVCTALAVMHLGRRAFGRRRIGVAAGALYLAVYYSRHFANMATPDGLVTLPLTLAVLSCLTAPDADRSEMWALAGSLAGVAALFKLPMGLVGIFMAIFAVMAAPRGLARSCRRLAELALGFALPVLLSAGFFWLRGGMHDLLFTVFVFGPDYVGTARAEPSVACLVDRAVRLSLVPIYALAAVVLGRWAMRVKLGGAAPLALLVIGGWCATTVVILVWHGKYNPTHTLPLIGPLALLGAHAWHSLSFGARSLKGSLRASVLALVWLAILLPVIETARRNLVFSVGAISGQPRPRHWFDLQPWEDLAGYLAEHTSRNETFFLWGNRTGVYLEAGRRSPSRFIHMYFLSVQWSSSMLQEIFLEEFEANKPTYFVLDRGIADPPCNDLYVGPLPAFLRFGELRAIIERDYEAELKTENYQVFRLKGDSTTLSFHSPASTGAESEAGGH